MPGLLGYAAAGAAQGFGEGLQKTGAALREERLAEHARQHERSMADTRYSRDLEMAESDRAFRGSESEAERGFRAGESAAGRSHQERLASERRGFDIDQAELDRAFRTEQAGLGRSHDLRRDVTRYTHQTGEAEAGRRATVDRDVRRQRFERQEAETERAFKRSESAAERGHKTQLQRDKATAEALRIFSVEVDDQGNAIAVTRGGEARDLGYDAPRGLTAGGGRGGQMTTTQRDAEYMASLYAAQRGDAAPTVDDRLQALEQIQTAKVDPLARIKLITQLATAAAEADSMRGKSETIESYMDQATKVVDRLIDAVPKGTTAPPRASPRDPAGTSEAGAAGAAAPKRVETLEEAQRVLSPGDRYIGPDGVVRTWTGG